MKQSNPEQITSSFIPVRTCSASAPEAQTEASVSNRKQGLVKRGCSGGSAPSEALGQDFQTSAAAVGNRRPDVLVQSFCSHLLDSRAACSTHPSLEGHRPQMSLKLWPNKHERSFISLWSSNKAYRGKTWALAVPLQFLHIRAGLREDADAPTVRRPSVQVERQMMQLCWLTAESRHLVGSWDGSQVVDSQEVSRLRRQAKPNTSVKPRPRRSRPPLELSLSVFPCWNLACLGQTSPRSPCAPSLRYLVGQQMATEVRLSPSEVWTELGSVSSGPRERPLVFTLTTAAPDVCQSAPVQPGSCRRSPAEPTELGLTDRCWYGGSFTPLGQAPSQPIHWVLESPSLIRNVKTPVLPLQQTVCGTGGGRLCSF